MERWTDVSTAMTAPAYVTNWGPLDGPILGRSSPPALSVFLAGERLPGDVGLPIGIAYPTGLVERRRGPAVTFRLAIGKTELEGRWLCDRRAFVRLGEAAEPL
jgi:hypothetical protein